MSEIKVNSIKGVGASQAAITIDNSSGACTANLSSVNGGAIGTKNLIINGGLNVYQRGSARAATSQGAGYATADRWKNQWNNLGVTATETLTDLTSSDSPYAEGHRKYLRYALASAGTAAAGSYIELSQLIEAQNLATSGWDYTSSSSKITLQFWFRCSTNQTFYCSLQTADGTSQAYVFPFTASGNNAWTKITHTISGNSNITFNNDNGVGLYLRIIPYFGTTYSGTNVTNNSWVAFNTDYVPDMATTWLTAGASTFDFTGVQLEIGSTASTFVHETYAETLRKCHRYFYLHADGSEAALNSQVVIAQGCYYGNPDHFATVHFPVRMRSRPSLVQNTGTDYYVIHRNNAADLDDNVGVINRASTNACLLYDGSASGTAGQGSFLNTNNASARVSFSSEL